MKLIEVTKEEFYSKIGPLDVVVSVRNDYSSDFKLRNGKLVGRTVPIPGPPYGQTNNRYFMFQ